MNYGFLRELITLAEEYEQQQPEGQSPDKEGFTNWLVTQQYLNARQEGMDKELENMAKAGSNENEQGAFLINRNLDSNIAVLLAFMNKFSNYYSKRVFKYSAIYSVDDFGFAIDLFPDQKLTKAQLIRVNFMEKSSGMEVIKRLIKQGILQETENPEDGRSKLVMLTDQGRANIIGVMPGMANIGKLIVGNLNQEQKMVLLQFLRSLHQFHEPIYLNKSEEELEKELEVGPYAKQGAMKRPDIE